MNSKLWIRKALSSCLMVAILATYSMVALASDAKASGELLVTGGDNAVVTVDGTAAASGRTIFSGSTFSTSENASATLNLGTAGTIRLAPKSTAVLTFDGKTVSAAISAGALSVINGGAVQVNGQSVLPGATVKADDDDKDDDKDNGAAWWAFGLVLIGASAVLIGVIARDNNRSLGGTAVVVSPTR